MDQPTTCSDELYVCPPSSFCYYCNYSHSSTVDAAPGPTKILVGGPQCFWSHIAIYPVVVILVIVGATSSEKA